MKTCYLLLLVLLLSCSHASDPVTNTDPVFRGIEGGLTDSHDRTGLAPLTVEYEFQILFDSYELDHGQPVLKIEVDPGNGTGFVDMTDRINIVNTHYEFSYEYTYSSVGNYTLRARATYWDGEIITYVFPVPITVLPPEEGDGA